MPSPATGAGTGLQLAELLWPGAEASLKRGGGQASEQDRELYAIPNARHPRLLLPVGVPGAVSMLRRHSITRRQRVARSLLRATIQVGAGPWSPVPRVRVSRADDRGNIEHLLGDVFHQPVRVGVMMGPVRVNAKPVLPVFDSAGRTVGFAKISTNSLTAELVAREGAALQKLAGIELQSVHIPEVLHHGTWQGEQLLVLSALRSGPPAPLAPPPTHAMNEVARCLGTEPALAADQARALRLTLSVARNGPFNGPLSDALETLEELGADLALLSGVWHGDWSPWNMSQAVDGVNVWDWERFEAGVPIGSDVCHYLVQQLLPRVDDADQFNATVREQAQHLLKQSGVPTEHTAWVLAIYLGRILTRYATEGSADPPARLRRRVGRLMSLLSRIVEENLEERTW